MNERIKQLADQAGVSITAANENGVFTLLPDDVGKFAELLIRECVEICKKQEYKYWRSSEEDQWTPIDSANAIEQHFGVE